MSFERFSAPAAAWDDPVQSGQHVAIEGDDRDRRIDQVRYAIEGMEQRSKPRIMTEEQWYILLRDLRHVAENWIDIALICEWPLIHLFGSPAWPRGPVRLMGAALLLDGRSIESIDQNRIVIANRLGAPNIYRRHSPAVSEPFSMKGAELIWDVIEREEWQ
jgi:hypothetical protein